MNSEVINVVYACNDDYAVFTAISIRSLLKNTKQDIVVHLILNNVSEENIKLLTSECKNSRIYNINSLETYIGNRYKVVENHVSTYARLFLDKIINDEMKIIWIDSDTIICSSIEGLYKENLKNNICGMVPDCSDYFRKYNLFNDEDIYYNAGIAVIDLEKWNKEEINKKIIKEIKHRRGKSPDWDQSYLNCILKGRIKTMDKKYNCLIEYLKTTKEPVIVHYAGGMNKPRFINDCIEMAISNGWEDIVKRLKIINSSKEKRKCDSFIKGIKTRVNLQVYKVFNKSPKAIKRLIILLKYGYTIKGMPKKQQNNI